VILSNQHGLQTVPREEKWKELDHHQAADHGKEHAPAADAQQLCFSGAPEASKFQIKQAIERTYNVKVTDVRTMNRKGKPRRARYKMTTTSDWKKAVVVLDENSRIELF
jgi:large subunit ribosomal protein L23